MRNLSDFDSAYYFNECERLGYDQRLVMQSDGTKGIYRRIPTGVGATRVAPELTSQRRRRRHAIKGHPSAWPPF